MKTENIRSLDNYLEAAAWGLMFILWGVTILIDFIPFSIGILGTGLILLGLNGARSLKGIPTRPDTTTAGILGLVWGSLLLANSLFHLPFKLNDWAICAILLISWGVIILVRVMVRTSKMGIQNPS